MIAEARAIAGGASGGQELQRDFAIEPRVPGAVDFAERSPADPLDDSEVTPVLRRVPTRALSDRPRPYSKCRGNRRRPAVYLGNGCQHLQVSDERARGPLSARLGRPPSR